MTSARDAAAGMAISQPGFLVAVLGFAVVVLVAGMFMVRLSAPILVERMLVDGP
jgi:hypothetical protein